MEYPAWLGKLTNKQEHQRAAAGLYPARDGWYKTVAMKKRYIAKPMPLADVLEILSDRLEELTGGVEVVARVATSRTTLEELGDMYLAHLWQRHTTGVPRKLERRTYDDYKDTIGRFVRTIGGGELAKRAGPEWFSRFASTIAKKAASSRRRDIIYLTAFFNWAGPGRHSFNFYKVPVQFGADLVKPDEWRLRDELEAGSSLYTPDQLLEALTAVKDCPLLFAAGLLGFNCAFLPVDLSSIPETAVDLERGVHNFPRGKTGIKRMGVLMPETVWAIRRYLETRPARAEGCDRLFVREDGRPFNVRRVDTPNGRAGKGNAIADYWSDATGLPFKGLRTTFATAADGSGDDRAVDLIMGHVATSVRHKHYVKQFDLERLRAVHERVWLQFLAAVPLPGSERFSCRELAQLALRRRGPSAKPRPRRGKSGSGAGSSQGRAHQPPRVRPH